MYDAIVLGLGGVGSMALRGLARQGRGGRFLGIEGHSLLHDHGSSHGKTRIYRQAYFEHANYVPWIRESIRIFREMEAEHQVKLIQECGTLIIEASEHPTGPLDPQTLPSYCRSSHESAQQHGIPVEYIDATNLKERYPQFQLDRNDFVGLFEPCGGFVRCEQVSKVALDEAKAAPHVDIMTETRALSLAYVHSPDSDHPIIEITLQTHDQPQPVVIATKCLLVSMGAWTGQLFTSWAPHLRPIRQFQTFFNVDPTCVESYSYPQMPTWIMIRPDFPLAHYGIPCDVQDPNGDDTWLKVGMHGRDVHIPDPSQNPRQVSREERQEVLDAARQFVKVDEAAKRSNMTPDNAFASISPCFYTMTTDAHFMLGTPKGHNRVFCVSGLSGHGYKMAPALGQMMVDYALSNDMAQWKLDFCSPSRFGV